MLKESNKISKAILVIIFYLVCYSYPDIVASALGIDLASMDLISKTTFLIAYEMFILLIIIYVYRNELIPMFKDFIHNIKSYFSKYFKYWILMLLLMLSSNILISFFTTSDVATNQEIIESTLKKAPVYILISTIIVAPLLEELIFRFCIKYIVSKPKILYILISGIFFGSMHVIFSMQNITDLLFIIPYSIPGIIFAYLYNKTNNIFIPIGIHFMHNSVLMILQFILG